MITASTKLIKNQTFPVTFKQNINLGIQIKINVKSAKKDFLWRSTLLQHLKLCDLPSEHRKRLIMRFNCDDCDYKTNHKTTLIRHTQAKHLREKPNINKC